MEVTSLTHWVVKDYAYQTLPGRSIFAGQMTELGFDNQSNLENIVLATANKTISVANLNETTDYNLYAINGQLMIKGSISKENNKIDTSMFSSGIYIIELLNPQTGQVVKKKLIL